MAVFLHDRPQALPLVLRQDTPDPQQHTRIGLFKVRARLRNGVNLL